MSAYRFATPLAALLALGSEGTAAPVAPITSITPSGAIEACDGEQIAITGLSWDPVADEPVTCGRIHLQLWDGEAWADLDSGLSDQDGFSVLFDTAGLAGSELEFRAHFEPGGSRGVGCPGGSFRASHSETMMMTIIRCEEGCGQGFWKNHVDEWTATGYSPDDRIGDVFIDADLGGLDRSMTLMQALESQGGPGVDEMRRILLCQAVAALLNANHPDVEYPLSLLEVLTVVAEALDSGDRSQMEDLKGLLDAMNNLSCPLGS